MTALLPTLGVNFAPLQVVLEWDDEASPRRPIEAAMHYRDVGASVAVVMRRPGSYHLVADVRWWSRRALAAHWGADLNAADLWQARGYPTLRVSLREGEVPQVLFAHLAAPHARREREWSALVAWLALISGEKSLSTSAYMQPAREASA